MIMPDDGRDDAVAALDVSRETAHRLDIYVAELRKWQNIKNLVGPATLPEVWHRHILDSGQLVSLAPDAESWLDLGSGAGLPGLIIACMLAETKPGAKVTLVESNSRKCAFLQSTARACGVTVDVICARIEDVVPARIANVDVVTARALAPLSALLGWTEDLWRKGARGLFLKGQDVEAELTEASKSWKIQASLIPSRTLSDGRIVDIAAASRL